MFTWLQDMEVGQSKRAKNRVILKVIPSPLLTSTNQFLNYLKVQLPLRTFSEQVIAL